MLQPVTNLPDHGLGRLGQVAHGVLTAGLGWPPAFPRLYLGYNTMPEPPVRLPSYLGFDADQAGWEACGRDMLLYLRAVEASLQRESVPSGVASSEACRRVSRITRVDSIVLLYRTDAEDAMVALALDRDRFSVMMWAPPWNEHNVAGARPREDALALALQRAGIRQAYADPADVQVTDGGIDAEVRDALGDILDGQYACSRGVTRFTDSNPRDAPGLW